MSLVKIEGLTKNFLQGDVEVPALRGVDLEVGEGDFAALVGPSGSGKTTLLNHIGGLDRATSGKVLVNGVDLSEMGESKLAEYRLNNIGFVFQAYNLVPVLSAVENVEFIMVLQGHPAADARKRAIYYLERVGLQDYANRRPKALSGGQQQRVAVARALAAEPRLILADEPTANLDTENALGLLEIMRELNDSEGMTFLFSTHDVRVVEQAKRVVELRDGRVAEIVENNRPKGQK